MFVNESKDKFLNEVIEQVYTPSNVEILESKQNKLIKHKYYKLKCKFVAGNIIGADSCIFIAQVLTHELYTKLITMRIPIIVLYCFSEVELANNTLVSFFNISPTTYIKQYNDLCILTGFGRGYQNLDVNELNSLSFGRVKDYKFIDGELQLSSHVYLLANDLILKSVKDKYSYYALQGKNLTIECTEEYLEKVRCIVSIIKALQNNGIFYGECKTLRILKSSYQVQDKKLADLIDVILRNYLSLFKFNSTVIDEIVNNNQLKSNFNVICGNYDDEYFTSLDYYLNVFNLLDSNVKVLSRLA